ncbi:DUF4296 domain-containing protein [Ichthyobacterium seriolicida]|uniref:DUF4296 domain-containing protein n=1 Tax=Ichthyobacterium seriolicida TaxID=242600 RepID=A0A1J1DY88_9FLAO|nr:DUF4296 domain-containing protein [Ichthyobacterium seriolicida]BAV94858.1 hypothetical protein JBKA6_0845 [Ichthyobacterium seriolicida]
MKNIIILLLMSCFISCEDENTPVSNNILSEDQFVSFLLDMSLLEGVTGLNLANKPQNNDTEELSKLFIKDYEYMDLVYKKHKVTDSIIKETISFYSKDLELYKNIYKKVLDSLKVLKVNLEMEAKNKKRSLPSNLMAPNLRSPFYFL